MGAQQQLSAATEEWRRRRAVELHEAGWTGRAIAAALGVVPSAVSNWLRKVRAGGVDALRSRRHATGRRPKLTPAQQQRLLELLQRGAEAHGAIGARWTRQACGSADPAGVWRPLPPRIHPPAPAVIRVDTPAAGDARQPAG